MISLSTVWVGTEFLVIGPLTSPLQLAQPINEWIRSVGGTTINRGNLK